MKKQPISPTTTAFDSIRRVTEPGDEACIKSSHKVEDHFEQILDRVGIGSGARFSYQDHIVEITDMVRNDSQIWDGGVMKTFRCITRPLVPFQGTGNSCRHMSQGIARLRLPQPWAMLFRPVGPMDFAVTCAEHRAPNGGQDHSPGLSNAMPWDTRLTKNLRPNRAREMLAF